MKNTKWKYYNMQNQTCSDNLELLFPDWGGKTERLGVLSPHDDDALLGAGYLMVNAMQQGADVYVIIFCRGDAGYSDVAHRETVVHTRRQETLEAYGAIGIDADHITRLDYSDFSILPHLGWKLPGGRVGSVAKTIPLLREMRITRLIIPNGYREHIDHETVHRIGSFDGPQAGDPILVDWAAPSSIKTYLEYAVWGDFSPVDALVNGREPTIRANRALLAPAQVEDSIGSALRRFESQLQIIDGLLMSRQQRAYRSGFVELYVDVEPRPALPYAPYYRVLKKIDEKQGGSS